MLTPWNEGYDQPRQHIKERRHYFANQIHPVKVIVFPVVRYGCENWTVKKAECQKIGAFVLLFWIRPLRVPWTARRSNQSILKEISAGCSLEGMMLKLISFIIDWFDLLAVQGTLKGLLQYHISKETVPQCSVSLWSSSHIHPDYQKNHSLDQMELYLYISKHICTHTYVRKSFEKEYNSIMDEENKSTSIFLIMCILAIILGLKPLLKMQFMFMLIKETEPCLNLVTLTAEELIYNT